MHIGALRSRPYYREMALVHEPCQHQGQLRELQSQESSLFITPVLVTHQNLVPIETHIKLKKTVKK